MKFGSAKTPPSTSNLKVNFLRTDGGGISIGLVDWISRLGLPILLITAAIVFGCSFYKMTLDQELANIEDQVYAAAQTIQTLAPLEKELTATQSKYQDVTDVWFGEKISLLVPLLTVVVPPEITLNELSVTKDSVRFSGQALSQSAIATLMTNIQVIEKEQLPDNQQAIFSDLRIEEISSTIVNGQNGFNFSVRFEYEIK